MDVAQETERNEAAARHSWARQHTWLLLSFSLFTVRHKLHPLGSKLCILDGTLSIFTSPPTFSHSKYKYIPHALSQITQTGLPFNRSDTHYSPRNNSPQTLLPSQLRPAVPPTAPFIPEEKVTIMIWQFYPDNFCSFTVSPSQILISPLHSTPSSVRTNGELSSRRCRLNRSQMEEGEIPLE